MTTANLTAPLPSGRGRGRGRGRNTAPAGPATLGADVRVVQSTVLVGPRAIPMTVNRQLLDVDVDADFDPDKHVPSAARLAALERADHAAGDLYEDPYAETGRLKMRPAPGEVEDFRNYVRDPEFRANIQRFASVSVATADLIERQRIARETTEAGANVRLALRPADGPALVDRLAASTQLPPAAAARDRLLPPAAPGDADRIQMAEVQRISEHELAQLVAVDYLPGVPPEQRAVFLAIPCANTIVRRIWPQTLVPEPHRRHYNIIELVDHMLAAGCKLHSVSRVEARDRLGHVVDAAHYRGSLRDDTDPQPPPATPGARPHPQWKQLAGGHEHYDEQSECTRLVVAHFYCIPRPKQTKEQQQRQMAERLVGLAAQAEKEGEENAHFDPDEDIWDDTGVEDDDDYLGGNDLHNPASHFIYRCNVVCVEAVDCVCENEAGEPPPPAPPAAPTRAGAVRAPDAALLAPVVMLDGSEAPDAAPTAFVHDDDAPFDARPAPDSDADDAAASEPGNWQAPAFEPAKKGVVPDGLGTLTHETAKLLAGKFRAATFLANCQGARPFYPLCIRGMQFSVGEAGAE